MCVQDTLLSLPNDFAAAALLLPLLLLLVLTPAAALLPFLVGSKV